MNTYVKSPINYVGNKYKLLPQLIPLFPNHICTFVDLFAGSGTVLINSNAQRYIYNDINYYIAEIFEGFCNADNAEEIIKEIEKIISDYGINMTDKVPFEKLRNDYNKGRKDWKTLYALMCCSFSNQFRFNNKHEYNSSFGKNRSHFSDNQKNNLKRLKSKISKNIVISKKSFYDFNFLTLGENDFVYCDPPYLNSTGNYNDGKRGFEGWTQEHEIKLLEILDELNDRNIKWALSNNLKYDNPILNEWKDKYNIHYLNGDYSNCNYQKKDKSSDIEVLITNYNIS